MSLLCIRHLSENAVEAIGTVGNWRAIIEHGSDDRWRIYEHDDFVDDLLPPLQLGLSTGYGSLTEAMGFFEAHVSARSIETGAILPRDIPGRLRFAVRAILQNILQWREMPGDPLSQATSFSSQNTRLREAIRSMGAAAAA